MKKELNASPFELQQKRQLEFIISRQVTMQRLIKEWTAFHLLKYDLISSYFY